MVLLYRRLQRSSTLARFPAHPRPLTAVACSRFKYRLLLLRKQIVWIPNTVLQPTQSNETNTIPLMVKKNSPQQTTPSRMNQLGRTSGGSKVQFT